MNSSIKLTLAWFKKRGHPCAVIESFVKPPFVKFGWNVDKWGSDVQALIGNDTLNVQCCLGESHKGKVAAAMKHPDVIAWLTSPHRKMWVMSFAKRVAHKKDGSKKKLPAWTPRVTEIIRNGTMQAVEMELS